MALRFFTVSVRAPADTEAELNAFLAQHKVLQVDRRWVDLGADSFWAICVDYLPDGAPGKPRNFATGRSRIDYKEVLTPEEFAIFVHLRELRREIAQAEAVPIYTVFTNEQLAQIVQRRCRTRGDLQAIDGVGEARIQKYADQFLSQLIRLAGPFDAPNGESV